MDRELGAKRAKSMASPFRYGKGKAVTWCALAALTVSQPVALVAQTNQDYRYTPYGSPLDPAGTPSPNTSNGADTQNQNNYTTRPREPIDVSDTGDDEESDSSSSTNRRNQDDPTSSQRNQNSTSTLNPYRRPAPPSEFETYVERVVGRKLPRFGANLLVPEARDFAVPATATVPPGYVLQPGDHIFIGLSGSVDGSVDVEIDRNGRIFLPKVGSVALAGVRYGDLTDTISRAIGRQYRGYRVTASVTRLRGIRVYVTGFANSPGAYTVNSLSTMVNAVLAAGGPGSGGSFRSVQLYRNGQLVTDFDLYDFVRSGNKANDVTLENEDVLFIPPVGDQVAVTGSVNEEAIYETKAGETIERVLAHAGGANALADTSRVILYRLEDLDTVGSRELDRPQVSSMPAVRGDIVHVLSVGSLARPQDRQSVLVRLEGEVSKPGNYYVRPNASLEEVVQLAGGLTSRAFVYGTVFQRASVRRQQRESFLEAIQQMELTLAAAPLTGNQSGDAGVRATQLAAAQAVLQRLRLTEPDGRVVLSLPPEATALPGQLTLENNDRVYVPARPSTVGVFGAVNRPASFLLEGTAPRRVRDYVAMAGGGLRAADMDRLFVVRANGEVISKRNGALSKRVLPGDVVFVPVRTQKTSIWTRISQISSTIFQLGLTAAAFEAITE